MECRACHDPDIYSAQVSITAIVPLKALDRAKQRLASDLSPPGRRDLMARLFTHVVTSCVAVPQISDVLAVVGDHAGAALARAAGARAIAEPAADLNAAVRHATDSVSTAASLVVVADLPRLTTGDLHRVLDAGARAPCVVVAATRDGGTGALLRRPAAVIDPAFGPMSAGAHLATAQRAGIRAVLVSTPGLTDDVDRPSDLVRHGAVAAPRGDL